MANVFKRASAIYKKNPNKKWATCVKEAGREVKAGKKVGYAPYTRKKTKQVTAIARRKKKKNPALSNRAAVQSVKIGNLSSYLNTGAKMIAGKIGSAEAQMMGVRTAKAKRAIRKKINELKKVYRKLSK